MSSSMSSRVLMYICFGKYATGCKESRMIKSSSTRVITADTTHMHIEPSHIIEYEWPPKSGERYFIQVRLQFTLF